MTGGRPREACPAGGADLDGSMGSRDPVPPVAAADRQKVRIDHAERFGARARRCDEAHQDELLNQSARRVSARRPDLTSPSAVQPDCEKNSRPHIAQCTQHGQSCLWHAERRGEERVRERQVFLRFCGRAEGATPVAVDVSGGGTPFLLSF